MRVALIDPKLIQFGDRARTDLGNIQEMKESIQKNELIQPLAVEATGDTFLLLAGGRRLTAILELGLKEIPVRIYDHALSTEERKNIELAENIDRLDMSWSDKIRLEKSIHSLQVKYSRENARPWKQDDTAEMLNVSQATISQDLSLAEALEEIPELKNCKTKDEANKKLRIMKERFVREELSKRLTERAKKEGHEIKKTLQDAYMIGDALEGFKNIPSNTFHVVELDPPYAIEMDQAKSSWDYVDYKEMHRKDYLANMTTILNESFRVLVDSGWLIFWHAPDPWGEELYLAMTTLGFRGPRTPAIWTKPGISGQTSRPETILGSNYESFFYATKKNGIIIKQGRNNIFNYPVIETGKKVHPTERPIELITEVLNVFSVPGCKVFVPFLGSGNSILAAANQKSYATGFELTPEFKQDYIIKVNESPDNVFRSYGRF